MITTAIVCCTVFLIGLITSYWWGPHNRFTLGWRLFDAKNLAQNDSTSSAPQAGTKPLDFDYIFERKTSQQTSASTTGKPRVNDGSNSPATAAAAVNRSVSASAPVTENVTQLHTARQASAVSDQITPETQAVSANSSPDQPSKFQSAPSQAPRAQADDLKQIFGIGKVFENLLNGIGISTFDQLANISDEQLETVRGSLGVYSGRIEKDNWIAQAVELHEFHHCQKQVA